MKYLLTWIGQLLAKWLSKESHTHTASPLIKAKQLLDSLQPGDVVLVDGNSRISSAIKYLTQSTWSHAALFVGHDMPGLPAGHCFIEADMLHGVRSIDHQLFMYQHCRICRPVGLSISDCNRLVEFATNKIGMQYDIKNIIDLARYLLPNPPVPIRIRRHLLQLGSGDPTKAICSTLIAQAFQSIHYPILPDIEQRDTINCPGCQKEILHIRHHSLFVPRDFDVSPYFQIIKPGLGSLNFHQLTWSHTRIEPNH